MAFLLLKILFTEILVKPVRSSITFGIRIRFSKQCFFSFRFGGVRFYGKPRVYCTRSGGGLPNKNIKDGVAARKFWKEPPRDPLFVG